MILTDKLHVQFDVKWGIYISDVPPTLASEAKHTKVFESFGEAEQSVGSVEPVDEVIRQRERVELHKRIAGLEVEVVLRKGRGEKKGSGTPWKGLEDRSTT